MDVEAIMASAIAVPFPAFDANPPVERAEKLCRIIANLDSAREAVRANIINLTPDPQTPNKSSAAKDTEMTDAPPPQAHSTAKSKDRAGNGSEDGEITDVNQDNDHNQEDLSDDAIIASISTPRDSTRDPASYALRPAQLVSTLRPQASKVAASPLQESASSSAAGTGTSLAAAIAKAQAFAKSKQADRANATSISTPTLTTTASSNVSTAASTAAIKSTETNPLQQKLLNDYDAHMSKTRAFYVDALRRTRGVTEEMVAAVAAAEGGEPGVGVGVGVGVAGRQAGSGLQRKDGVASTKNVERVLSPVTPVTPVTPLAGGGTYDASRDPRRRR